MEGYAKAKEVASKLKVEKEQTEEKAAETKTAVMNQLAQMQGNSELARMYQENASLGADNLAGELPLLKVHSTGKSSKNELADGSEPNDGAFFYKPTAEQFGTLRCHILTISRGFKAEGFQGKQNVFHQVLGGLIVDNGEYKPFLMYFTGKKLGKLWEFGKEAAKYTRAKPVSIPMFALSVSMTTVKEVNDYGRSWLIKFEIEKDETGFPKIILDPGEFEFVKGQVADVESMIASIIEAKASQEVLESETVTPIHEVPEGAYTPDTDAVMDVDTVPF